MFSVSIVKLSAELIKSFKIFESLNFPIKNLSQKLFALNSSVSDKTEVFIPKSFAAWHKNIPNCPPPMIPRLLIFWCFFNRFC